MNEMIDTFMGEPVKYWLELQRRSNENQPFGQRELINEIANLRGKVAFYESRVQQMAVVMERK